MQPRSRVRRRWKDLQERKVADLSLIEAEERGSAHGGVPTWLRVLWAVHEQPCSASPQPKQHASRARRLHAILAEVVEMNNGNKRRRYIRNLELENDSTKHALRLQKHLWIPSGKPLLKREVSTARKKYTKSSNEFFLPPPGCQDRKESWCRSSLCLEERWVWVETVQCKVWKVVKPWDRQALALSASISALNPMQAAT